MNYYKTAQQMLEEAPKDYKYLESMFDARIEDSKEYRQLVRRMPYQMWDGKIPFDVEAEVVPMKSIHLTTDNLERLVTEFQRMERQLQEAEYDKKIVRMLRADERVRDDNPSVAKAYRNYLTLLELARK